MDGDGGRRRAADARQRPGANTRTADCILLFTHAACLTYNDDLRSEPTPATGQSLSRRLRWPPGGSGVAPTGHPPVAEPILIRLQLPSSDARRHKPWARREFTVPSSHLPVGPSNHGGQGRHQQHTGAAEGAGRARRGLALSQDRCWPFNRAAGCPHGLPPHRASISIAANADWRREEAIALAPPFASPNTGLLLICSASQGAALLFLQRHARLHCAGGRLGQCGAESGSSRHRRQQAPQGSQRSTAQAPAGPYAMTMPPRPCPACGAGYNADQLAAGLQVGLGVCVMLAALSPPAVWSALSLQPAAITPVYAVVTFCVVLQPNLGALPQQRPQQPRIGRRRPRRGRTAGFWAATAGTAPSLSHTHTHTALLLPSPRPAPQAPPPSLC